MDVTPILEPLNDAQREAVTAPEQTVLVLAGAGSGKTRVLTHRMAWLEAAEGVAPWSLLAVTFTNKAAAEMRHRMEQLLGAPAGALWAGTFHGIAHRLLRQHYREAGLPQSFTILDADDQLRVIKRVLKALELDESRWPPRMVRGFINARKDEGERPQDLGRSADPTHSQLVSIYSAYEETCRRAGLVDFAELLLRAYELWRDNPEVLKHYQTRFRHILVDEFQDTNAIQYNWLKLLAGSRGHLFIVGDDDQSIYGWRGARIENIHRVQQDFSDTMVVRLEQNYRSTGTILNAANALIAHNSERMGKNLWTEGSTGEPIQLYAAYNERDEAQYIVERVRQWAENGGARSEVAILYRSNAQSRVLEEAFLQARIPYRVYGGMRFFERAEIKDALAYLRLLENRDDDASFERVVNLPTRGIGARTLDEIRAAARDARVPLWQAAEMLVESGLNARAGNAVRGFLDLIVQMQKDTADLELAETIEHVIEASGLRAHHGRDKSEQAEGRLENLDELVSAGRSYEPDEESELPELADFLAHAALEAGEGQAAEWEDCVQLMTLHSVKGLEFPLVFMCGLEDGLFPHQRALNDPSGQEEERRLCYVGMTRAMRQLVITYAETRRLHGTENLGVPSRFLREIPAEHVQEVRPRVQVSRPVLAGRHKPIDRPPEGIKLGASVRHAKFGNGVVLNYEGNGPQARVQVNFQDAGTKWLVLAFANLDVLG